MADRESNARIDDAAAIWAARIDARALTADEEIRLERWLAKDIRRQGALARALAVALHMADGSPQSSD
ncbi:hypothetical protein [Novosphingobium taihuense]|uniref:Ferric-dicitrate binding protein FerR (Iron transport regulator) n=1 Tax=Novosphingobium taihuense TaxID=260085 RepID=A0A7W7A7N4_9SPHN|nr:hypothetical protein [Novosphingobium taihuense]MBB4611923.1 ferric-dicitrate binding protein FerR (iron transport regulator) [Novosphingobium taihuense]